jgi:RNA polymerase sigma factor (sigma-70 family)
MTKIKAFGVVAAWLSRPTEALSTSQARNVGEQVTNLYQTHSRQLIGHLTAVYGNPDDAAEVAQQTYLRMYDLLAAGHTIDEPRIWAYRVSRNQMLDRLKKRKNDIVGAERFSEITPSLDTMTAEALLLARERSVERMALFRKAFAALTETERQCVYGRGQGLSLREVAGIVGLSTKRVSEVTGRAIQKMQRTIGG